MRTTHFLLAVCCMALHAFSTLEGIDSEMTLTARHDDAISHQFRPQRLEGPQTRMAVEGECFGYFFPPHEG
jgi:hypothetical protein